jgi:hypothetical protein
MRRMHLAVAVAAATGLVLAMIGTVVARDASDSQTARDRVHFAVLTGVKEVDAEGTRGTGDLNGRGSFSATLDGTMLCYGIQVKNIDTPVAAHIHRGIRSVAGGIVVPLQHPAAGNPGQSGDCMEIPSDIARGLRENPGRFYVNVHTGDFPNGAVRGQLFPRVR